MQAILGLILWACSAGTCTEPVRDSDLLTYARVAWGSQASGAQAGGNDAVAGRLWVCLNRFVLLRRAGRRVTAAGSCGSYSTATSERWAPGGPACGAGGTHVGHPMCSDHALRRRSRVQAMDWRFFARSAPGLRAWLVRFFRGEIPRPPGFERVVHTGGCVLRRGQSSCFAGERPGAVFLGSNVAWPTRASSRWTDAELPRLVAFEDACDELEPGC